MCSCELCLNETNYSSVQTNEALFNQLGYTCFCGDRSTNPAACDCERCCFLACCPCLAYAQSAAALHGRFCGGFGPMLCGVVYLVAEAADVSFGLNWLHTNNIRVKEQYNEESCFDCCTACCCKLCHLHRNTLFTVDIDKLVLPEKRKPRNEEETSGKQVMIKIPSLSTHNKMSV